MATALRNLIVRAAVLAALVAAVLLTGTPAGASPEKVGGGIRFTYTDPNAKSVAWAGVFNNWSTTANPMAKDAAGVWTVVIPLPAGEQQYKFVADGQWFADPENGVTGGDFGNSVVKVGPDGNLIAQAATSNTPYSPKISISGRDHTLFEEVYDSPLSRYELSRPLFDIDLDFGIRLSDMLKGHVLTNINPQKEDVQDYQSRLNWKRGSLEFDRPDLKLLAFDSETIPTWDDPAHLVGNIGIYDHPFGYLQDGFLLTTPKYGLDTQVLYSDNSDVGGTSFPAVSYSAPEYDPATGMPVIDPSTNLQVWQPFEPDTSLRHWLTHFPTVRSGSGFVLTPNQLLKITSTDVGNGGNGYGYGDGATNVFAASVRHTWSGDLGKLRAGLLGRTDRGYHLGNLVLAQTTTDSSGTLTYGQTEQESFAGGAEVQWTAPRGVTLHAEYLQGAHRLDMMDRALRFDFVAHGITAAGPGVVTFDSLPPPLGQHYDLDESSRFIGGGSWTFAQGDVGLFAEYEHQVHHYPVWSQPPLGPAGLLNVDHELVGNVDLQRGVYDAGADLDNSMDELRLRWDRNWRYYLGREVKTSLRLELTHFTYDPRTTWEYQMWFPTGNMWLQQSGQVVRIDRMTVLGEEHAYTLRPSIEVPIRRARNVTFDWHGDFTGTKLSLRPRYAENIFRFGFDVNPSLRFTDDTRWVQYNAPSLGLEHGYASTFAEFVYSFTKGIHVGLGWGVDPNVLDPVTNDFAPIGRETYLSDRNVNGYVAETNWLSLAPQIAAAEKALQLDRRIQFEAVVHF